MCSIWKLPVVFVVEHNQFASTTPATYSCSVDELAKRAAGYSMASATVDGNDVIAVLEAATEAVAYARAGKGPFFLENRTYRVRGHYEGDPQRYRKVEDVERQMDENDPIKRYSALLKKKRMLSDNQAQEIWDQASRGHKGGKGVRRKEPPARTGRGP